MYSVMSYLFLKKNQMKKYEVFNDAFQNVVLYDNVFFKQIEASVLIFFPIYSSNLNENFILIDLLYLYIFSEG